MPIGADLLQPIPGAKPSGENLRYAPVYIKIKEARWEEDDAPQGQWQHERKKADWILVQKLAVDALAGKSKDLQLAAWLTEALLHNDGFAGLREGLDLVRGLVITFWDTLYPEMEDGDLELRAAPLEWIGSHFEDVLKGVPLTRNGLGWFQYKESRAVGYEGDVGDSESKRTQRETAIAEGKLTAEEFDDALKATPKVFYQQLVAEVGGCLGALEQLKQVSDEKLRDLSPTYSTLRETLEVVRQAAGTLLQKKQEQEPDAVTSAAAETAAPQEGAAEAAAAAPVRRAVAGGVPASVDDAFQQVLEIAGYLRGEQPQSPVPYLLVRALRWGELRAQGSISSELLTAPSSEVRQQLKQLAAGSQWPELLQAAEAAAGQPCGRAWLDVHRYAVMALRELGAEYEQAAAAVCSGIESLLADYPDLMRMSLLDDTPVAGADTQAWLQEAQRSASPQLPEMPPAQDISEGGSEGEAAPPDAYELAKQAMQAGRPEEAIDILQRDILQEPCERARFQRRIQLAQVCMAADYAPIAGSILQGLAEEIEQRKLEQWESPELIAHTLALLFRCWEKLKHEPEEREKLYERICRLDPVQGLELVR
ncbi:MAG TPA: type VI secretion system protein TssA [Terriglobales bacterium]|nr:type VI secretion system protein TssA [Terriglobales bacterium]